jgi:uncharacterized surface protein with fasciclin (FAS1) repeats
MKSLKSICQATAVALLAVVVVTELNADEATVWTKVQSNPETTVFAGYANELGLADALNTQNLIIPWTLFVPSNDAFAKLPAEMRDKLATDDKFKREIITSHMVLGAAVSADGIGSGNALTTVSGENLELIRKDDLYIKDVVVTAKDLVGSNGVVHLIECVMYVQPSVSDDRLTDAQKSQFKQTACCLADSHTDFHHPALLK